MRYSRLTSKDMTVMKEQNAVKDQSKQTSAALRDHTNQHRVEIFWGLNEDCDKDRIFKLKIDNLEVLLDSEQVLRALRWV